MSDTNLQENTMNLYDFNQILMAQMQPLDENSIQKAIQKINDFKHTSNKYYMLLCRDINYYTVFSIRKTAKEDFGSVVIDCARNAGTGEIISVELTNDQTAVEIWINVYQPLDTKNTIPASSVKTPKCMYLFNYDNGICYVR